MRAYITVTDTFGRLIADRAPISIYDVNDKQEYFGIYYPGSLVTIEYI